MLRLENKVGRSQIRYQSCHVKNIGKEKQINPKVNREKEIIKIKNEIGNKNTIVKKQ